MPKFLSVESNRQWIESVRQTKSAKKQQTGTTTLPCGQAGRGGEVLARIDAALLRFDEDKVVFERATES